MDRSLDRFVQRADCNRIPLESSSAHGRARDGPFEAHRAVGVQHWGGLASLWVGGWTAGGPVPLEVWGPSCHPDSVLRVQRRRVCEGDSPNNRW
jgi:hypothetical protein